MVVWIVGECGLRVVFVDYCFVLEYLYFVVIDDVQFVYEGFLVCGFGGDDIILMGDSVGGGFVFILLNRIEQQGLLKFCVCVVILFWGDLIMFGVFFWDNVVSDIMLLIGWIVWGWDVYVGVYDVVIFEILLIFVMFIVFLLSFLVVVKDEFLVSDSYIL